MTSGGDGSPQQSGRHDIPVAMATLTDLSELDEWPGELGAS